MPRGAKSRMHRTETPKPIWIRFCTVVDITDIVTYTNFGDYRLRGFWVTGVKFPPSPIDFHRRPYNTFSLPCEYVISCLIRLWGLLGKWMKYSEFVYLNIFFLELTYRSDPSKKFSRSMAQTTRTRARVCLLGVSLILFLILAVKSPKPHFRARKRGFSSQADKILNVSYYQN